MKVIDMDSHSVPREQDYCIDRNTHISNRVLTSMPKEHGG